MATFVVFIDENRVPRTVYPRSPEYCVPKVCVCACVCVSLGVTFIVYILFVHFEGGTSLNPYEAS